MAQLWSCKLNIEGRRLPKGTTVLVQTQGAYQQPDLAKIEDACKEQHGVAVKNTSISQWVIVTA